MAVVAGLPCSPLSTAAVRVREAARPNRRRPPRWTGAAPSAGRGEMDSDDGDEAALPLGRSVLGTTPGAAKLSVKGTSPSPIRSLDTEMCGVCVAYQGSPGTVIEAVVLKAFSMCTAVPHKRFEAALEAVESSLADIVVLPIENSYTGSFHQSYDILLSHDLQIVQEVQMDVELCLLALPGVHKDDLKKIFSHPQYLAQCEHSISNLSVSKKDVDHGAAGAEIISKKNLRDTGVIGSARAAELYGLNILECNFQFNYIFYVDFEASTADVRAQNALKYLQEIASFLRVLGCYPYSTTIT